MSSLLVSIAIVVACLFSAARSQWVHCGPDFGFPTLRNCQAALDVIAAVPHPETAFMIGPRVVLPLPDVYLPFSIQLGAFSPLCAH